MTPVVREHETGDEALVVVLRQRAVGWRRRSDGRRLADGMLGVHPARGLLAALLELPRQPLPDQPRAALDLAPVAWLDLQALGKSTFESAQRGGVGVFDGVADEFVEQRECVVQADRGHVSGGVHGVQ